LLESVCPVARSGDRATTKKKFAATESLFCRSTSRKLTSLEHP
jgi:hypothetical protein